MKILIEYCEQWNYLPQALRVKAVIADKYNADVELIPSSGGVFEIKFDNVLVFSKKKEGRFPSDNEVMTLDQWVII